MSKTGHHFANLCVAAALVAAQPSAQNIITGAAAFAASSAPDSFEGVYYWGRSFFFFGRNQRLSLVPHRTITHWPLLWLALLVLSTLALRHGASQIGPTWFFAIVRGVSLGALVHLFLDAFSPMGIPVFNPFGTRRRIAALYTTGSVRELLLLAPIALLCGGFTYLRWEMFAAHATALVQSARLPI